MKNTNEFVVEVTTMETFAEVVTNVMALHYGDEYKVMTQSVPRNNGLPRTGLMIMNNHVNITPTIYLDGFYTRFTKGESLDVLCKEMIELYEENKVSTDFDISLIRYFENVQDVVCFRLVNAKMNQELLKNVPHILFHDLAIVFYILLSKNGKEIATITIQNNYLDVWEISTEELYKYALRNTKSLFDIVVTPVIDLMMREFVGDMSDANIAELYELLGIDVGRVPLYRVTNKEKMHGATVLLHKEFLREFASDMNSDLYIIPSSIHEVLIIPTSTDAEIDVLKVIVDEVNRTDVSEDEILSYSVYTYNRATDLVEMY